MKCVIDKEKLKNRSLKVLLSSRMCPSCKAEDEEEMMRLIKEHCSKREDFFHPLLPFKELIFRILLSRGNEPISLEELESEVRAYLIRTKDTRTFSQKFLRKIIEEDTYYGLALK